MLVNTNRDAASFSCSGLLLLDFGKMMAKETAVRRGTKLRDVWLDSMPCGTLRAIAATVITSCWAGETPLCHQRLTERELEKRFGRARSCFPNAAMSASDYWRASLLLMKKEIKKWHDAERPAQAPKPETLHQNTFCSVAAKSFQSALKLSAMCSDKSRADLQAAWNLSLGQASWAPDDEEEDDNDTGREWQGRVARSYLYNILFKYYSCILYTLFLIYTYSTLRPDSLKK